MKIKLRMVLMSHLSDAETNPDKNVVRQHLEFVKFLLMKYKNTDVEIIPENEWECYQSWLETNKI